MSSLREEDPPALQFTIQDAGAVDSAGLPALCLSLAIDAGERAITRLSLKVQVQIRAERRRYSEGEAAALSDLFGPVEQWGRSLGPVPWTTLRHEVDAFDCLTTTELHVACRFDFGAAVPKYLAALQGGAVPLELLFSGTLSWMTAAARPLTAMIPWDREAYYRLPERVWTELLAEVPSDER